MQQIQVQQGGLFCWLTESALGFEAIKPASDEYFEW
jgi:hypothetical protein